MKPNRVAKVHKWERETMANFVWAFRETALNYFNEMTPDDLLHDNKVMDAFDELKDIYRDLQR